MRVVEKNFVTNGIDFIWRLQQFGRDFSIRLDETAMEVYKGTRPSRHFEGREGVGLCPISSNPAEKNPEVRVIF